jgi:hypothetical protein
VCGWIAKAHATTRRPPPRQQPASRREQEAHHAGVEARVHCKAAARLARLGAGAVGISTLKEQQQQRQQCGHKASKQATGLRKSRLAFGKQADQPNPSAPPHRSAGFTENATVDSELQAGTTGAQQRCGSASQAEHTAHSAAARAGASDARQRAARLAFMLAGRQEAALPRPTHNVAGGLRVQDTGERRQQASSNTGHGQAVVVRRPGSTRGRLPSGPPFKVCDWLQPATLAAHHSSRSRHLGPSRADQQLRTPVISVRHGAPPRLPQ